LYETRQGIQLTKNFNSSEFACKCCGRVSIDTRLVLKLQELRDEIDTPIYITSGFRCKKHNREVGGARCSLHRYATASDIKFDWSVFPSAKSLVECLTSKFDGVGLYPKARTRKLSFVHVDLLPDKNFSLPHFTELEDCANIEHRRPLYWWRDWRGHYHYFYDLESFIDFAENYFKL